MRRLKELNEIHEIMGKIYDEEKDLNREQRLKKIREESDRFLSERMLSLKRVKLSGLKQPTV